MKVFGLAVLAAVATAAVAYAGGLALPISDVAPIVEEQPSSSAGWVIPVILIGLIALALGSRDSGGTTSNV